MSISYDASRRLFKIDTPRMSYAFCIAAGVPIALYWGAPLHDPAALDAEIKIDQSQRAWRGRRTAALRMLHQRRR